jgi:hypothetical protein
MTRLLAKISFPINYVSFVESIWLPFYYKYDDENPKSINTNSLHSRELELSSKMLSDFTSLCTYPSS